MMCLSMHHPKCVAEIGNRIMAMDGCMNIYASTADKKLSCWNEYNTEAII